MTLQEEITEALGKHQVERGHRDMARHCTCGWSAPYHSARPSHEKHQAAILTPIIEAHTREAARQALVDAAEDWEGGLDWEDMKNRRQEAPHGWTDKSINDCIQSSGPICDWLRARAGEAL